MKGISEIDKLGVVKPKTQGVAANESDGDLFKKTFEKVMTDSGARTQSSKPAATSSLGEIQAFGLRLDESTDDSLEKNTDRLLGMLDHYSKALNDPGKSLKEIEPLLKSIKEEAGQLSDAVKNGSQGNDALKSVAEKSSLLANVEYIKFMRGDYV